MDSIIRTLSIPDVKSAFIKDARIIFLPEHLKYNDFDITDPKDIYENIKTGGIRPYLVTFKESRRYPVLAVPSQLNLTLVDIQSLIKNDYNCKVRVVFWRDREFDHNGECLECDAWPDACECYDCELNDGYVKLIHL